LGAGVAVAFGAGAVSFALVALVLSALGSDVLVLALGVACVGLGDRLAVLDGRLRIESPVDGGTLVAARIPLPS
jgi:hypothetical protein